MGNLCGSGPKGEQPTRVVPKELKKKFTDADQGHVFKYWDSLTSAQRETLITDLNTFDPDYVCKTLYGNKDHKVEDEGTELERIDPQYTISTAEMNLEENQEERQKMFQAGLDIIKAGKVTTVILAGGQGSRLGSSDPKGMFNIDMPSGKSIFQILTERFFKAQMLAHNTDTKLTKAQQMCKLLIMTSNITHKATVNFYKQNNYFGFDVESFLFFPQDALPALDHDGKVIMKSACEVQLSPNGNGALFQAIQNNSTVKKIIQSTKYVQVIGVDNVMNKLLDPMHIGFTATRGLEASLKCCVKRSPDEKVGVVLVKNGKYDIIEYSEIPVDLTEKLAEDGSLYYELGNILMFMLSSEKLLSLCNDTKTLNSLYHTAHKKIEFYNPETGKAEKPDKENGYKFELFIHNFLPFCQEGKFGAMKVSREDEFGPVKNANGQDGQMVNDSPAQARSLLLAQHSRWVSNACEALGRAEFVDGEVEVDLLVTYEGEGERFKEMVKSSDGSKSYWK